MLNHKCLVVKIGHDTAENEPLKVCQELAQSQNRVRTHTKKLRREVDLEEYVVYAATMA